MARKATYPASSQLNNYLNMNDKRLLFVTQEVAPYIPGSNVATLSKELLTKMHSKKFEVRSFMPKLGDVNERRNQLHEVIRLSGLNIPLPALKHSRLTIVKLKQQKAAKKRSWWEKCFLDT